MGYLTVASDCACHSSADASHYDTYRRSRFDTVSCPGVTKINPVEIAKVEKIRFDSKNTFVFRIKNEVTFYHSKPNSCIEYEVNPQVLNLANVFIINTAENLNVCQFPAIFDDHSKKGVNTFTGSSNLGKIEEILIYECNIYK